MFFPIFFLFISCEKVIDHKKIPCKDFKIGKFEIYNKNSNKKYLLERTKDFQVEKTLNLTTNTKSSNDRYYKISWKNDCEYNLILDTTRSQYDTIDLYINSKGGYHCLIKSIEGNCAIVETKVDGEDTFISKICKTN